MWWKKGEVKHSFPHTQLHNGNIPPSQLKITQKQVNQNPTQEGGKIVKEIPQARVSPQAWSRVKPLNLPSNNPQNKQNK